MPTTAGMHLLSSTGWGQSHPNLKRPQGGQQEGRNSEGKLPDMVQMSQQSKQETFRAPAWRPALVSFRNQLGAASEDGLSAKGEQ
jgi:hypothetical protein